MCDKFPFLGNTYMLMLYILQLSQLKELFLYGNKIAQLPSEVGLMTNLETLAMSENNITDLPG